MPIFNENVRTQLIDFLSTRLSIPSDGVWYHCLYDTCEDDDWFEDFKWEQEADYEAHGCSKIVLFYRELPHWVIKIPFMGCYYEDEDIYEEFTGGNINFPIEQKNDYCAGEVYITQEAKKYGLEEMFAKTYYLADFNGYPVYVSEKVVNSYWDGASRSWQDENSSREIARNIETSHRNLLDNIWMNERALAHFIDIYGELKTYDLLSFIKDMGISDLHDGNIGFTKDMQIKILDYSGYDS